METFHEVNRELKDIQTNFMVDYILNKQKMEVIVEFLEKEEKRNPAAHIRNERITSCIRLSKKVITLLDNNPTQMENDAQKSNYHQQIHTLLEAITEQVQSLI